MLTFAFAQGFLYGGNYLGRVRLGVEQEDHLVYSRGLFHD